MKQLVSTTEPEAVIPPAAVEPLAEEADQLITRERIVARLRVLWDERRFLSRVAFYGVLASTAIAFVIPKQYQATARLMPPDQSSSNMAMFAALAAKTGGIGAFAGDLLGLKGSGALFVGILRSRTVEDRLVDRFNLKKVYGTALSENARKELAENTSISEDRKSGIITIQVKDNSAKRAAALGNGYIEELNRLVAELSTSAAHRERVFIEERLKAVKQELDSAAKEFSQFASKNAAIDIKEQGRAMVEAAATLQGQLIAAHSELSGLEQIYTGNNVRVRSLRARINELQRQLERLGGKNAVATGGAGQEIESLYPSIRKLPLLGVTYADLYRRTKIQETVYELLTQQYELAKVQEAKETPSVKVLDVAEVPEKKSFPPRLLIMFLGTFFAFAGAVFWILGRARWEETDAQDPRKVFAQEVFQTVKAQISWSSQNGSRVRAITAKLFSRFNPRRKQPGEGE